MIWLGVPDPDPLRNYRLGMRTYCMRSACRGHAVALVSMNVQESSFTVYDLAEVDGPGRVVLCERHLNRLRAPVGWLLYDERTGGDLVAFPRNTESWASKPVDLIEAPTTRSVDTATHPLASPRIPHGATSLRMPARSKLGVHRHPASVRSLPKLGSVGPVEDPDEVSGFADEQLTFESSEPEPTA